jgi:hypothetical protein
MWLLRQLDARLRIRGTQKEDSFKVLCIVLGRVIRLVVPCHHLRWNVCHVSTHFDWPKICTAGCTAVYDCVVDHAQQSACSAGHKTIGADEIGIEFGRFGIMFSFFFFFFDKFGIIFY